MIEVLLDNKDGNVWTLSDMTRELTWSTSRVGKPASVGLTIIKSGIYQDKSFRVNMGDVLRVRSDDVNLFYGYVFSLQENREGEISIKAYDQVRYLLNKHTYVLRNVTTGDVIRKIADDFQLVVGRIDDTGYRIPVLIEDGQTLLDVIEKANTHTMHNATKIFVFFDDFGELSLRDASGFIADFYVGDESLMTQFDYSRDIDRDTYNRIKLYRDNTNTGKREVYMAQDSANIAQWGVLQLYQSVEEDRNEAQIHELLDQLAKLKNRETRSLKLEAVGEVRLRAGMYIRIIMKSLALNQFMLIDEVSHKFEGANHSMSLTLKVI